MSLNKKMQHIIDVIATIVNISYFFLWRDEIKV